MDNMACSMANLPPVMTDAQRERAIFANKVYCKACQENRLKICSWDNFSAWRDYVDGKIGETELAEKAQDELKSFTETFRKYTIVSEEESRGTEREDLRRGRAKHANDIYRKVCVDSGLSHCFFKNFSDWTDYVDGGIGEAEFVEKARAQVDRMAIEAASA